MKQPENAATFETRMARLQEIVAALEDGELPLEKGVALYKEGMELSCTCRKQLEKARNDIRIFTDGALQPFTGAGEDATARAEDSASGEGL